jgi:ATP-dependent exoDNAse (exonuclease V) beta subunit
MSAPIVPFDAACQPLTGRCLIEASAGTGKTYAITSKY